MSKFVLYAASATALAVAGAALAGVALAGSAGSTHSYKATLAPGAEVPKPKAPAAAKGTFTATVTASGSTRTIHWKLTFKGLSGKAVGAHVHKGKARRRGRGHRPAVRSVPEWADRAGQDLEGHRRPARARSRLRERAHGEECRRGDSGPGQAPRQLLLVQRTRRSPIRARRRRSRRRRLRRRWRSELLRPSPRLAPTRRALLRRGSPGGRPPSRRKCDTGAHPSP